MTDIYRLMETFLNYTILDNSIEAYLSVLGVVLVIFIHDPPFSCFSQRMTPPVPALKVIVPSDAP